MNDITYAVSVDVNNPIIPYNVYVASVLDSNVRYLEITLYENGNVIALSNTATATASLVTDNVLVNDSVNCTIQDNIITVPLEDLQRHGNLDVQVTVTEGTKVLAIPFPIQVRVTPNIAENAQIDENSLGSYAEVVHEIAEARGTYTTLHDAIAAKLSAAPGAVDTENLADESITVEKVADDLAAVIDAKEVKSNKKTTLTGNESSNDFYPTTKAVADALNTKVSSLSNRLALHISVGFNANGVPVKFVGGTTISSGAFTNSDVTKIFISQDVQTISNGAFAGCPALSDIYFDSTSTSYDNSTIPSGVTAHTLDNYHIMNCILDCVKYLDDNKVQNNVIAEEVDDLKSTINDLNVIAEEVGDLKSTINDLNITTEVNYDDEDLSTYTSTATNSSFNCTSIPIAPNANSEYYIKAATVKTQNPNINVKFAIWTIAPYYYQQDPLDRKRFTKKYDLAVIVSNDSGLATIEFDMPVKIIPDAEVLMASCQTNQKMAYGTYVDSAKTSFIYGNPGIWYDVKPGESPDYAATRITSGGYCPWYEVKYVLSEDVTAIVENVGDIEQKKYNISPYDSDINKDSDNAVRNSVIYNELNITKTETIIPTDTTWKSSEAVQPRGYNGWFTVAYVGETDAVKLKKLDIFATTGASVKLGIWTYRPHAVGSVRGYLTLKSVLGTVTAADSHAVFNLDNVDFDPSTEFLGIAASSGAIGYNTGVVNGFIDIWFNSDKGFYDTAVGEKNSQLMNAPGRASSSDGSVQGNYTVTYQLVESKTVTTVTNVKNAVDTMIGEVKELKHSAPVVDSLLRTPHNKYFCVLVDDLNRDALTIADRLLAKGVRPAFGHKMESLGSGITWDEMKKLQDMGFEIAFHGMLHSHTPAGTAPANDAVMIADIAEFKALCNEHGIILHGYLGPNHYPLPVGAFKEFEWARSPYGLDAYGAPSNLGTTFASVKVWSCDPLSESDMPSIKQTMISAASSVADDQYLVPMCHTQNLVTYIDDYMAVFEAWIAAGLEPMRPMDAVKQSLFNAGGIGNNSTFKIQAGTATNPYYLIAGNGTVLHNP